MKAPDSPLQERLLAVQRELSGAQESAGRELTLVAVSKTKPDQDLMEAYAMGQKDFGENRVQELVGKAQRLPKDILWHMIGHVQTNKIKDFLPWVHLVHGVDRVKVLRVMQKEAAKTNRKVRVLLQVHIAEEATKFGFDGEEILALGAPEVWEEFPHLLPVGLMGMATFTEDQEQVRREFSHLAKLHRALQPSMDEVLRERGEHWSTLSMGMSGDWRVAVQEGSTMVRVGSAIFGTRNTLDTKA